LQFNLLFSLLFSLNKTAQEKLIAAHFPHGGKVFPNNKMQSGAGNFMESLLFC